jgi:hypothetical protein
LLVNNCAQERVKMFAIVFRLKSATPKAGDEFAHSRVRAAQVLKGPGVS